jgi:hypothetical protein
MLLPCLLPSQGTARGEDIEGYFRAAKQNADSTRVRVWDSDTLIGRMFVQFVSLCYYEYLSEEVRKLKLTPAADTERPSDQLKLEKRLKSRLENTPIYLQLQWFDAIKHIGLFDRVGNLFATAMV